MSAGASAAPAAVRPAGTDALPSAIVAASVMAAVVVIWGLGPPVTKLISAPPLVAVSMRFWISVPLVWAVMYATGGRVTKEVLRRTALAGALFGVNLAFVFAALHHSSVAVLAVIQTLQPGVVLLVAGKWLGERATGWHISWTAVGVLGVVVAILGGKPEVRGDALGIVFGVGVDAHLHRVLPAQPAGPFDDAHPPDGVDGRRHVVRRTLHHADRAGDLVGRRLPPARRRRLAVPAVRRRRSWASSATR